MNDISKDLIVLNDNGAWSWFMDERVIVHQGKLLVGSVRSSGQSYRFGDVAAGEIGACELTVYDLATGVSKVVVLHAPFEQDDHNGPSLHVRPDGRVVAIYSRHSVERKVFWRISQSQDLRDRGPERVLEGSV